MRHALANWFRFSRFRQMGQIIPLQLQQELAKGRRDRRHLGVGQADQVPCAVDRHALQGQRHQPPGQYSAGPVALQPPVKVDQPPGLPRGCLDPLELDGEPRNYGSCDFELGEDHTFEPTWGVRGDTARAYLYAYVWYGLPLTPSERIQMLTWHIEDPPDTWEKTRNELIMGIQGNRNPFVGTK